MPLPQSERDFSQAVYDLARLSGWLVFRTPTWRRTGSTPGFPDMVMIRVPTILFVELKSQRGRLSEDQEKWIDAIRWSGGQWRVWRPSDFEEIQRTLAR